MECIMLVHDGVSKKEGAWVKLNVTKSQKCQICKITKIKCFHSCWLLVSQTVF